MTKAIKQVGKSDPALFTHVRTYKKSVGKSCKHCGRPATVLVNIKLSRKRDAMVVPDMAYCQEHAEMRGVFG